jgi:hypothetical protein
VLFRFGARHKLRQYHRGEWAFLPGGEFRRALQNSAIKVRQSATLGRRSGARFKWHTGLGFAQGAYDLECHHLTPNGRFRGTFVDVERFYTVRGRSGRMGEPGGFFP